MTYAQILHKIKVHRKSPTDTKLLNTFSDPTKTKVICVSYRLFP